MTAHGAAVVWSGALGAAGDRADARGHADALTQRRRLARRRDGLDGTHQVGLVVVEGCQGDPQDLGNFFFGA